MSDQWGPGDLSKARSLSHKALIGKNREPVELFFGEHPHSRQDNDIYAKMPDGEIVGFDGHRPLIEFCFVPVNYVKRSELSGDEIRKGGEVKFLFDGVLVYSEFCREYGRALEIIGYKIPLLLEHPIGHDLREPEKIVGRKVYYRDVPAVVGKYDPEEGTVTLVPERGHEFKAPARYNDDDNPPFEAQTYDRVDIFSAHVWWFRK